jgi:gluconokinase
MPKISGRASGVLFRQGFPAGRLSLATDTHFMSMAAHLTGPTAYIAMGVSGSGKSMVGKAVADHLGLVFVEGDALHPTANIDKMKAGIPLTDDDRLPWLDKIGAEITAALADDRGIVVSCSALKRIYRDQLRSFAPTHVKFLFLSGSEAVLAPRMSARTGHFMPTSLLQSQLATLEDPSKEDGVITVDIAGTTAEVIADAIRRVDVDRVDADNQS